MTVTAERLRELLSYERETGVFTRLVNRSSNALAGSVAGCVASTGKGRKYFVIWIDGKLYYAHRLAWLHVHGRWPDDDVDHVDGDGTNNKISNLRAATRSQNMMNTFAQRNNKSGFKGVSLDKPNKKWVAKIQVNGHQKHLGLFKTAAEAHAAYVEATTEHHGEFGRVTSRDSSG